MDKLIYESSRGLRQSRERDLKEETGVKFGGNVDDNSLNGGAGNPPIEDADFRINGLDNNSAVDQRGLFGYHGGNDAQNNDVNVDVSNNDDDKTLVPRLVHKPVKNVVLENVVEEPFVPKSGRNANGGQLLHDNVNSSPNAGTGDGTNVSHRTDGSGHGDRSGHGNKNTTNSCGDGGRVRGNNNAASEHGDGGHGHTGYYDWYSLSRKRCELLPWQSISHNLACWVGRIC